MLVKGATGSQFLLSVAQLNYKSLTDEGRGGLWWSALAGHSLSWLTVINTLRPRQNGRYFADDIFKCIFLNENVWIPIEISLKFAPEGSINNNPALFQIMAWRRPGDKPIMEPMMDSSLTHICVTRPQWVNTVSSTKWRIVYLYLINIYWHSLPDVFLCWPVCDSYEECSL